MHTDIDFLVFNEAEIENTLSLAGYVKTPFFAYFGSGGDFYSWRKGSVNLIVTSSIKYAESFQMATHICKNKNVREKHHRVLIHEALRGNSQNIQELSYDLRSMVEALTGPYGYALQKAYRAQHSLFL